MEKLHLFVYKIHQVILALETVERNNAEITQSDVQKKWNQPLFGGTTGRTGLTGRPVTKNIHS